MTRKRSTLGFYMIKSLKSLKMVKWLKTYVIIYNDRCKIQTVTNERQLHIKLNNDTWYTVFKNDK